jgi:hypothetical protein
LATGAEGATLATRERLAGVRTPITWAAVVDRSTTLAVEVTSLEQPGTERPIAIAVDERRPADSSAVAKAAAARAIEQAERFEREGQLESALAHSDEALSRWRDAGDRRSEAYTLIDRNPAGAGFLRPR